MSMTDGKPTVRDLIEHLQGYPPDARVYDIDGMSIVAEDAMCSACESTGKTPHGTMCPACKGTGNAMPGR